MHYAITICMEIGNKIFLNPQGSDCVMIIESIHNIKVLSPVSCQNTSAYFTTTLARYALCAAIIYDILLRELQQAKMLYFGAVFLARRLIKVPYVIMLRSTCIIRAVLPGCFTFSHTQFSVRIVLRHTVLILHLSGYMTHYKSERLKT